MVSLEYLTFTSNECSFLLNLKSKVQKPKQCIIQRMSVSPGGVAHLEDVAQLVRDFDKLYLQYDEKGRPYYPEAVQPAMRALLMKLDQFQRKQLLGHTMQSRQGLESLRMQNTAFSQSVPSELQEPLDMYPEREDIGEGKGQRNDHRPTENLKLLGMEDTLITTQRPSHRPAASGIMWEVGADDNLAFLRRRNVRGGGGQIIKGRASEDSDEGTYIFLLLYTSHFLRLCLT